MAQQSPVSSVPAFRARRGPLGLCLLAGLAWMGLLIAGGHSGLWTLVALSLFTAIAFLAGALVYALPHNPALISRVDAAAAGAMLTTALVLIVPHVLFEHAGIGALGMLLGLVIGMALHGAAADRGGQAIFGALTLHSLCDGIVMGAFYTLAPSLGLGVGVAILAHKAPAGYVLARRLADRPGQQTLVVLPALATGLGALAVAFFPVKINALSGLIFGAAAGLFLFVALAFFASNIKMASSRGPAHWLAFIVGGLVIALIGWLAPHGV